MIDSQRRSLLVLAAAVLAVFAPTVTASQPTPTKDVLKTLKREHPRLIARAQDWAAVKQAIASDELARAWHKRLQADARRMLTEPPVEHKLIGPRLLDKSRKALRRISTLAGLYRLDGNKEWAERARKEMLAAAAFPDWNPSHFLDVAEMSTALGLGYDWLYAYLSAEDRATIRTALVEKGLKPGMDVYKKGGWWTKAKHNWNQVCNGGLTIGALAIADEEPELARAIVTQGRASIPLAMASFAPDGGWAEGPGYWGYATEYNVFYLACLQSALGTDFGLSKLPGFDRTGGFRIHAVGPLGKTFNFADAGDGAGTAAQMLWLARTFDQPSYAAHERTLAKNRPSIFHLLWIRAGSVSDGPNPPAKAAPLPLDAHFKGVDAAFFRSSWDDPRALYVGFRGGDNAANHSHLDLGNFVMDALGQRWALDLGGDDYNLPGYFGKERWSYYRLRTEGHNTLTIDNDNQVTTAKAPLIAFHSTPERAFAVADLSAGYKPKLTRVRRGLAVLHRNQVLVQDEIEASQPVNIVWNFHTKADIKINGNRAILTQGKQTLEARILTPPGATFTVVSANPPAPQKQQPDVSNLTIRLPGVRQTRIAVLLTPAGTAAGAPTIEPLDAWVQASKLGR